MAESPEPQHLSQHHRVTLDHIERHPTTHNLEWHDVIGLLREAADVVEEHDGKFRVRLGDQRLVLTKPKHDDVSEQMVLDLRRMFTAAGYTADKK